MANANQTILIGRLVKDPELTELSGGYSVANVSFVTNRKYKTKDGSLNEEPMFIDCKMFGKRAEVLANNTKKGSQLYIEGHLRNEKWQDKDGNPKSKHVIEIDNFEFLDSK